MSAPPARRRSVVRAAALAVGLVLLGAGAAGCTGGEDTPLPARPSTAGTDPADLSGVRAVRAPFCDALDDAEVTRVLGGAARHSDSYRSGDRRRLAPGLVDVAHEYGCSYRRGRHLARAWLFAQPVSRTQARRLLDQRRGADGCAPAGTLGFGAPGLVQSCRSGADRRVTMAGRFGDGWLTCEVVSPAGGDAADAVRAAERWCAGVAVATAS